MATRLCFFCYKGFDFKDVTLACDDDIITLILSPHHKSICCIKEQVVEQDSDVEPEVPTAVLLQGFPCTQPQCKKILTSGSSLARHLAAHNKPKTIPCDECGKLVKNIKVLKWHKRQVHGIKPVFNCTYCDETKTCQFYLNVHINNCHKSKYCPRCKTNFDTGSEYKVHNKTCAKAKVVKLVLPE